MSFPQPARALAAALLLCIVLAPTASAQFYASFGGGYARLDDVPRYGTGIAFYVPAFEHTIDVVPSFELFYRKWNGRSTEVGTLWSAGLETRLNLPPVFRFVRPYAGLGFAFVGVDGDTRLSLKLVSGTYVRLFVRDVYPFAQVAYRVADEFETVNLLDSVFIQTGIRFALF
ncbi:MAG: hypothetical protein AAFU38_02515 [Bacteroidota bacterium]